MAQDRLAPSILTDDEMFDEKPIKHFFKTPTVLTDEQMNFEAPSILSNKEMLDEVSKLPTPDKKAKRTLMPWDLSAKIPTAEEWQKTVGEPKGEKPVGLRELLTALEDKTPSGVRYGQRRLRTGVVMRELMGKEPFYEYTPPSGEKPIVTAIKKIPEALEDIMDTVALPFILYQYAKTGVQALKQVPQILRYYQTKAPSEVQYWSKFTPDKLIKMDLHRKASAGLQRYMKTVPKDSAQYQQAQQMIQGIRKGLLKTQDIVPQVMERVAQVGKGAVSPAKLPVPTKFAPKPMPKEIQRLLAPMKPPKPPIQPPTEAFPPQPEQPIDPVQKVISVLKKAKSIRGKQETLYTKERAARIEKLKTIGKKVKGEKGFYAELAQLKGLFPKLEFETIRNKINQKDIDDLFNMVKNNPLLNEWQKITTRTGLAKLFGEYGGAVPTEGELKLLKRVFGEEFVKTIEGKQGLWKKIKEAGYQLINIPRSVMASFDFSAPFRQGVFLIGRGKQFWSAFGKMFKPFFSEKTFQALQNEIMKKPTFDLMEESGLALTGLGETLSEREEIFMSFWAERIPGIGKIVRASERAYVGFLNKLRADVFDDLLKKAEVLGLDPKKNKDLLHSIAKFVNAGSGRGSLGAFERAAIGLNTFFFSPRLMASRLTLLNPLYYINQPPFVRKEALKSLFTFAGLVLTVLGLAKLAGTKVGADPRSADFGKIKIDNTRIDILGGFQQYIRIAAQLITGEYVSSTTGKIITIGEGFKPLTRLSIIQKQIETKQAPVFSFITSLLKGTTFTGEPVKVPKEIGLRFTPMVIQDMYDIMQEDPTLLPISVLALFGVGMQTYKGREQAPLEKWRRKRERGLKKRLEEWRRRKKSEKQQY